MKFGVGDKVIHWTGTVGKVQNIERHVITIIFPDNTSTLSALDGTSLQGGNYQVIRHLNKLEQVLE